MDKVKPISIRIDILPFMEVDRFQGII